jgi:hypothetical protein
MAEALPSHIESSATGSHHSCFDFGATKLLSTLYHKCHGFATRAYIHVALHASVWVVFHLS